MAELVVDIVAGALAMVLEALLVRALRSLTSDTGAAR